MLFIRQVSAFICAARMVLSVKDMIIQVLLVVFTCFSCSRKITALLVGSVSICVMSRYRASRSWTLFTFAAAFVFDSFVYVGLNVLLCVLV